MLTNGIRTSKLCLRNTQTNLTPASTKDMSRQLTTLPADHFDGRLEELAKVIPSGEKETAARLARFVLTALNKTPELRNCTPESVMGCMYDLAAIGLEPNTPAGLAYLIPYGGKCTLQIGVNGFAKLAYNSNQVKVIKSGVVREGDRFEYVNSTKEPYLNHTISLGRGRDKQPLLATWASVELINGGVYIEVMDADDSDKILRLSKSPASKTWEDEFRKKSVLKRALKRLQIGGMETVVKAVEIDNRNTVTLPVHKPHAITFEDSETIPKLEDASVTHPDESRFDGRDEERDPETGEYLF